MYTSLNNAMDIVDIERRTELHDSSIGSTKKYLNFGKTVQKNC